MSLHSIPSTDDEKRTAFYRAVDVDVAIVKLRESMRSVRDLTPMYEPGTGPTAENNCEQILKMLEFCAQQIRTYLR